MNHYGQLVQVEKSFLHNEGIGMARSTKNKGNNDLLQSTKLHDSIPIIFVAYESIGQR